MRSKNKLPAALLASDVEEKSFSILISLSGNQYVQLKTNSKEIAQSEYNKIRAAGVYGGRWIDQIELTEQPGS